MHIAQGTIELRQHALLYRLPNLKHRILGDVPHSIIRGLNLGVI